MSDNEARALLDDIAYDVTSWYGYGGAGHKDAALNAASAALDAAEMRGRAAGLREARLSLVDSLDMFERCASKIVPADYATGYREAHDHAKDAIDTRLAALEADTPANRGEGI